jgi:hypothetical protein
VQSCPQALFAVVHLSFNWNGYGHVVPMYRTTTLNNYPISEPISFWKRQFKRGFLRWHYCDAQNPVPRKQLQNHKHKKFVVADKIVAWLQFRYPAHRDGGMGSKPHHECINS